VQTLLKLSQLRKWLPLLRNAPRKGDRRQLVRWLYQAGLGRSVDEVGFNNYVRRLESGVSLRAVAEDLTRSAEFQSRHGSSRTIDENYLTALYRDGLGREASSQELNSWLVADRKGATRGEALAALATSAEALDQSGRQLVHYLFKAAFGRLADESGLAQNVQKLSSGLSLDIVAHHLVNSAEFQNRHGSKREVDTKYVTALYRDALGRKPQPEELEFWLAEAKRGATRAKVLAAFASSPKYFFYRTLRGTDGLLLINCLYLAAFGRPADESELKQNVDKLKSGVPLEFVAEDLAHSTEFRMRHGSSQKVDFEYLTALYRDGLGRQPDLKSLLYWLAQGEKGTTRAEVLSALTSSHATLQKSLPHTLDTETDYRRWIASNDTIGDVDRTVIRTHIAGLPFRPLISVIVIVPIETTDKIALRKSINSVVAQLYPYWEVCLCVDDSMETLVAAVPRLPAGQRIKVARTDSTEKPADRINAALALAAGDFVIFLRAGDLLPEYALYELAFELGKNEETDIVYTDHDRIGYDGQRTSPWFKPGWDPDLLLAQDYINDLAAYRRTLVDAVGLLRPNFEGAELLDLALRTTASTTPDRIRHLPAILCHRREQDKTDDPGCERASVAAASLQAVRDYLDSQGYMDAVLKPVPQIPNAIRVTWPMPQQPPLVSVIVPTSDRADQLARCVEGVLDRTDYPNLELLIVDNESTKPATHTLFARLTGKDRRVRILQHAGPFSYAALNNAGARAAHGELLVLLHNDIDVIESGWLRELVSQAVRPDVGIVSAKLLYPDGQVQHGGIVLGTPDAPVYIHRLAARNDLGYFGQLALPRSLSAVTSACAAIRRAVFFEAGGLDEVNLWRAYSDVDFCLRIGDHGYRVVWTPFAELFHLDPESCGPENTPTKRMLFSREWQHLRNVWGSLLDRTDPFHNPNLRFSWDSLEVPSMPRRGKPWHYVVNQDSVPHISLTERQLGPSDQIESLR
jgi:GT2 family glycosyltransferase